MRKLQIEDAEAMRVANQQENARSEESRYDHRLHGLLLGSALTNSLTPNARSGPRESWGPIVARVFAAIPGGYAFTYPVSLAATQ